MTETGGSRGTGRFARWLRFLVTHQVPVGGGPDRCAPSTPGDPTIGLVSCHFVAHGFGDQVVGRVERALGRRGHVVGPLAALDPGAPVVVVAHAAPRARSILPTADVPALAGRVVALVTYGSVTAPRQVSLDTVRAELSAAGARVIDLTASLDTAALHRAGATSRATVPADAEDRRGGPDPYGLLTLELVLDDLLGSAPGDRYAADRGVGSV